MLARDVLRAVAACAPGKRVMVLVPSGEVHELPIVPEPARPDPPNPIEVLSQQLLERDTLARAAAAEVSARADEALAAVMDALAVVADGQEKVVASIDENTRTLHLPVKPAYFPDGKLRHAQRAEKG
jgi:hypothetical protein